MTLSAAIFHYCTLWREMFFIVTIYFIPFRATETGEGNFYFIGHEVKEMFYKLKESISLLSKAASLRRRGESIKKTPATLDALSLLMTPIEDDSSTGGTDDSTSGELLSCLHSAAAGMLLPPDPTPIPPPYPPPLPSKVPVTPSETELPRVGSFGLMDEMLIGEHSGSFQETYESLSESTRNSKTYYEKCVPR